MRVLQILEACGGGTGRHVLDLCRGLVERGIEVGLVYSSLRMDKWFGEELGTLKHKGVGIYQVSLHRGFHPSDILNLFAMINAVNKFGAFDLIHGHSSIGGGYARLVARATNSRVVYTPNALVTLSNWLPVWKLYFYEKIERWLATKTDALIAVSDGDYQEARRLGYSSKQIWLIPNGISLDYTSPFLKNQLRDKWGLSCDEVLIGFVGRLDYQKNPTLLIDVFAQIVDNIPLTKLVFVGEGPLSDILKVKTRELGLNSKVTWLGFQNGREILPMFDIFALPSEYEGFPYVLLEAMHAGLAIISTDVGGVRMMIQDGESGFVVPNRDLFAFSEKMRTLILDRDLRARFGEKCRERVRSFSVDRMIERTIQVYQSICQN